MVQLRHNYACILSSSRSNLLRLLCWLLCPAPLTAHLCYTPPAHPAVLWLLLLSAGINKWADFSVEGSHALAGIQLALSSGVGFLLLFAIVRSGFGLARQLTRKYTARRQASRLAAVEAAAAESAARGKRGSRGDSLADSLGDKGASLGSSQGADDGGSSEIGAAQLAHGKASQQLPVITVLAGVPPLHQGEEAGTGSLMAVGDTPRSRCAPED